MTSRALGSLIAAILIGGCSFMVMRAPRDRPGQPPACTDSNGLAVVDGIAAGGLVYLGAVEPKEPGAHAAGLRWVGLVGAIPFVFSAIYGLARAQQCSAARARWRP